MKETVSLVNSMEHLRNINILIQTLLENRGEDMQIDLDTIIC